MESQNEYLFPDPGYQVIQASTGKRFANYLIDHLIFYLLVFLISFFSVVLNPSYAETVYEETAGSQLVETLLYLLLFVLYMFGTEALFKGKSLGKLITGTRAVNEDGSDISAKTALLRGLSRIVPFEAFSALGNPSYPWHDKWTNTYVIDEKASNRPQE